MIICQKLESMISAFAGDFSCMEGVSLAEYNGRNSCLKYAKAVIFLLKFVTETSFDFSGICDIIYHAEENGRKADRTEVSQWQRETARS